MAKDVQENAKTAKSPDPQKNAGKKPFWKKDGLIPGILAFLVAVLVIAAVLTGAFFIVIKNNFSGISERYRKEIQEIPLLRLALPEPVDPEDPELLTEDQLKAKYRELLNIREQLVGELGEANERLKELEKYRADREAQVGELETAEKDLESIRADLTAREIQLEADRKRLYEATAAENAQAFAEFFESIDPEIAKQIYEKVTAERRATEEAKKFAAIYGSMDSAAAAQIFEKMGEQELELIVETIRNLNRDAAAELLASMTPEFAAKVTKKLSESNKAQ